jgi:hypothetical protein
MESQKPCRAALTLWYSSRNALTFTDLANGDTLADKESQHSDTLPGTAEHGRGHMDVPQRVSPWVK